MSDITLIGLGKMGTALAQALLDAGHAVTLWNRTPGKAAPLEAAGGELAGSAAEAVAASPLILACLGSHAITADLLRPLAAGLSGKVVIDLSTGGAEEAEALVALLTAAGAGWQIGMINAYPSGIGQPGTAILCAGPPEVWLAHADTIRCLGGASDHVGTTPGAIPGLFAAMFTARQGFMFGLIHGGALCRRAGVPVEAFAARMPVTLDMARSYADTFARTVPGRDYDAPGATVAVYRDALDDVLATYAATGTEDAFPRLMRDLTLRAVEAGLADKELTALVEMLAEDPA